MKRFPKCPCNWQSCQEIQKLSLKNNDVWNGRFRINCNKNSSKNIITRKFSFKHLKIKKEYEDKTLHIARHHWSRAVVTYVIENNKQITTPISATDAKTLGMYDVFEKNNTIKKYVLSPTNPKSLVTSHFNLFLSPKPSSERAQDKITTTLQNKLVSEAIKTIRTHFKKMLQKKLEKQMLSTFINNKFNLQEKINKLDYKIQDL